MLRWSWRKAFRKMNCSLDSLTAGAHKILYWFENYIFLKLRFLKLNFPIQLNRFSSGFILVVDFQEKWVTKYWPKRIIGIMKTCLVCCPARLSSIYISTNREIKHSDVLYHVQCFFTKSEADWLRRFCIVLLVRSAMVKKHPGAPGGAGGPYCSHFSHFSHCTL